MVATMFKGSKFDHQKMFKVLWDHYRLYAQPYPKYLNLLIFWVCISMYSVPFKLAATELKPVLSEIDKTTYNDLFKAQENGKWQEANALITSIHNPILLGHVMAQRYLHPTKYRSTYKELKEWMSTYSDHPQATRIYKLALRRKPKNWLAPTAPSRARSQPSIKQTFDKTRAIPEKPLNRVDRLKARQFWKRINRSLKRGHSLAVKRALSSPTARKLLSSERYDQLAAKLGFIYFSNGRDEWALQWAGKAADRSGYYIPEGHWTAGLAAWRLERKDQAVKHFELAAELSTHTDWFHAAAAFWAARAQLVNRNPEMVNKWLLRAANRPRTFYGLLARKILGVPMQFKWTLPNLTDGINQALISRPRGKRAIALMEIGKSHNAERELWELARGADNNLAQGILALAAQQNMARLAVRLDSLLYPTGEGFDGASYPIPSWVPTGGFKIDRALIYALIRQESRFNPKAKSWAGARGLMQLMPRTARFLARSKGIRYPSRDKLYQPEINLTLGQKYIEVLLKDRKIQGDLFLMTAAWNGGPGNLNKWRKQNNDLGDPLFLIESLPSRETRQFIEKVLANLWIYRNRLGQDTPSLNAIAAGHNPVYVALGKKTKEVAKKNE